jgi:dTDP-4-dehydrorhamnose reductase
MKILLLGKNGQVGCELQRALQSLGQVIALDRHGDIQRGYSGNVSNFLAIEATIAKIQPDIVVNATAYTSVDNAESDIEQAYLINTASVRNLAHICLNYQALLVHYSTDYVFDGSGDLAWQETDTANPINIYGLTKRDGEEEIKKSGALFLIFRTSWVYGINGNNFIKTILNLAKTRNKLSIIDDQIGAPTNAALIANVTVEALSFFVMQNDLKQKKLQGIYHLAAMGEISWYGYAHFIIEQAKLARCELLLQEIKAVTSDDYPTIAKRPLNSRLNTQKLQTTFNVQLPDWKIGVESVLKQML